MNYQGSYSSRFGKWWGMGTLPQAVCHKAIGCKHFEKKVICKMIRPFIVSLIHFLELTFNEDRNNNLKEKGKKERTKVRNAELK